MAHDKSPERSNLILFYTILSVSTLVALAFVFQSYFTATFEQEMYEKVESKPNAELHRIEAKARKQLDTGPMPIERAKRELVERGRPASIAPEPSDDLAALQGWAFEKSPPTMGGVPVSVAEEPADGGVGPDGGVEAAGPPGPDGGAAAPEPPAAGGGASGTEGSDSGGLQPAPSGTTSGGPGGGPAHPAEGAQE